MDKDLEEIHRKIAAIQSKNSQAREENRKRFPHVTRFVDALEAAGLGPVKVLRVFGADGKLVLGKPDTESWIKWLSFETSRAQRSRSKSNRGKS